MSNVEKKSLEIGKETELAFQIADRYISIQEVDEGYDYSIMGADYKEIDGGVYDNLDVTIREALTDIVDDLKAVPDHNGAKGSIKEKDELIPIDYDGLMEKVEEANEVVPKNQESNITTDFRTKTNELFHGISEMNTAEIEEKIEKLETQIEYEEKRLKYCGYGKSDLCLIEGLNHELEELKKMLKKMEE